MPDNPFFRGANRMDWLFAVMVQTAADYYGADKMKEVLSILAPARVQGHAAPGNLYPTVYVAITDTLVFVVSASTKGAIQWIGNVLGSVATTVPPAQGDVAAYFGAAALSQYGSVRAEVLSALPGRQLVLIGFSLGGATVQIMKSMFAAGDGVASACVAFGNPRPGTLSFASAFPSVDAQEFGLLHDPIVSILPALWSSLGLHNAWIPFPPLVPFSHVSQGSTLFTDGTVSPGLSTMSVPEVVSSLADGSVMSFHNQPIYARSLRRRDLPEVLEDGYAGYPNASALDPIARQLFSYDPTPWVWGQSQSAFTGEESMSGSTLVMYFKDNSAQPLGFQEVYHFSGDDPAPIYNQAIPGGTGVGSAPNLSVLRSRFLSRSLILYAVRASHIGSPKKSYLKKFKVPYQGAVGVTETIGDGIQYIGYSANNLNKRNFIFRGVDSNWITADALTGSGDNTGTPLIEAFLAALKGAGLALTSNTQTIDNAKIITGATKATGDALITITEASGTSWPAGSLVQLNSMKPNGLLNGIYQVVGNSPAGQVVLSGTQRYGLPAGTTGKIRPYIIAPIPFDHFEFNGVGHKDCGRPSFLRRGRRPAQLRRR